MVISNEALEQYLVNNTDNAIHFVQVNGDGYHYRIIVVSDIFKGKMKVARQQWVYGKLQTFITTGQLHAISMETYTTVEWENKNG